jgi:hypothetical protein
MIRAVRKTVTFGIDRAGQGTGILCATAAQAATSEGRRIVTPVTLAIYRVDAHVRPGQERCLACTTGIVIYFTWVVHPCPCGTPRERIRIALRY